jgi:hypothetical protein
MEHIPPPAVAKKKRGCLRSCFLTLLVILAVILIPLALVLRVPQALGIWKSHPEALIGQPPDPSIGRAIAADLEAAGQPTTAMRVYLFSTARGERIAYAMADTSSGFTFREAAEGDPVVNLLVQLATANASVESNVTRVAINFLDYKGDSVLIVTASVEDTVAYANGETSESEFLGQIDGWADTPSFLVDPGSGL